MAACVSVTDGCCQRVGSIIRFRHSFQIEDCLNHRLHLFLVRSAVANQRLFDLQRRILADSKSRLCAGEYRDATRFTN